MWLFTDEGFFSVVANREYPDTLVVRGRVREDIERFVARVKESPPAAELIETPGADYPFRALVPWECFAKYVAGAVKNIDYFNFKDAVGQKQGLRRHDIYARVWAVVRDLARLPARVARR
jgi:hypothetical protein